MNSHFPCRQQKRFVTRRDFLWELGGGLGGVALTALLAEQGALAARLSQIRAQHPQIEVKDKCAVIVDDGIATGIDARVACRVARALGAREVVLAVPVAPLEFAAWRRMLDRHEPDYKS